jgi:pilus assembly protein CpaC
MENFYLPPSSPAPAAPYLAASPKGQKFFASFFQKRSACFAVTAAVLALALSTPAALAQDATADTAAPPPAAAPPPKPIVSGIGVAMGSGKIITLPHPVASIFAADPTVVEVRPASPTSLFVFGKGIGATTIIATDSNGNTVAEYSVTVGPSSYASQRIGAASQFTAPGSSVSADAEPGGIVVRGTVNTPEEAENVLNQAKIVSPTGTIINNLTVAEPIQVELKVRIAYMSRQTTDQLGIDWSSIGDAGFAVGKFAIGLNSGTTAPTISGTSPGGVAVGFPGGTFEGVIDALATDNLAHIVAEPTLTTLSGTTANFIVGGQFPVPVANSPNTTTGIDTITVEFKNYGVQLSFTPTVFSDGRISLAVAPQLSQITSANSFTSEVGTGTALVIPGLDVQAASSTVILGSGQGMAIAGLLEDNTNQTDNAVPGLGEVPVLGALFRGDSYTRQQQELVITVTPYLVNPVSNPGLLPQPDDGWTPPNDLQRLLLLRDSGTVAAGTSIPGDAGFMVQ